MPLIVFGLNHKTAPIEVREKLAQLCGTVIENADGSNLEAVPLFTCNRAEFYYSGAEHLARASFEAYLAAGNLEYDRLREYFYEYSNDAVIKHLFSVAAGLDSMIIGENQILHQVKESYQHSTSQGYVGKQLHSLFQKALEVGKKVRSETAISENRVSIASTAVELAESIFGPLQDSTALVVGAGEMANLVATHLKERGIGRMLFVNRTFETANNLAEKFNGSARPFDQLEELLGETDIIISSTSAPHPVIRYQLMKKVMVSHTARPMFIIDIAVPRDVEPECGKLDNLFLYDVDDLQNVVNENIAQRRIEAEKAQAIVHYEASQFQQTLQTFTVIPLIRGLREMAEKIRIEEFARFTEQHPDLDPETLEIFQQFSVNFMNKILHRQIIALKNQGSADLEQLKLLAEVLGIPESTMPEAPLRSLPAVKKESA
ncbi:MAG: glutamyl-tRNA reductase [Candidatus Rifleibacteriota bacterium]